MDDESGMHMTRRFEAGTDWAAVAAASRKSTVISSEQTSHAADQQRVAYCYPVRSELLLRHGLACRVYSQIRASQEPCLDADPAELIEETVGKKVESSLLIGQRSNRRACDWPVRPPVSIRKRSPETKCPYPFGLQEQKRMVGQDGLRLGWTVLVWPPICARLNKSFGFLAFWFLGPFGCWQNAGCRCRCR